MGECRKSGGIAMLSLSRQKILVFLGLTLAFSSFFDYLIITTGHVNPY